MPETTTLLRDNIAHIPLRFDYRYLNLFYESMVLSFNMEAQTQSNWCWAATSKSVSHFYSALSPWTQCKIASSELGQTCCNSPVPSPCNVPWYLDKALQRTQNFVSFQSGTISFDDIKNQLEQGLVVGARIGWNGGGGHFMVIYGVTSFLSLEFLYIDDPIYGKSVLTYQQFANNYQGCGTWTHTYFTKKHFYFIWWLKDLEYNPRLLEPIPEVRPLARFNNQRFNLREELPEPEFSTAHLTFTLGLNDIHEGMNLPYYPISLRVLELEDNEPLAVYEVSLDEANPQFLQLNSNKEYFRSFEAAIENLKRFANEDMQGELRTLRIPALNTEAAWVHYDDSRQDKFVLLRQFSDRRDSANRVFNEEEFKSYLNKQKAAVSQMDELMGAGGGRKNDEQGTRNVE